MNGKAIFGLLVAEAALVWGILLGGRLTPFLDVASGVFVSGQRVVLQHLRVRSELNGEIGVLGTFGDKSARWSVKLSNESIMVKPESMRLSLFQR